MLMHSQYQRACDVGTLHRRPCRICLLVVDIYFSLRRHKANIIQLNVSVCVSVRMHVGTSARKGREWASHSSTHLSTPAPPMCRRRPCAVAPLAGACHHTSWCSSPGACYHTSAKCGGSKYPPWNQKK